MKRTFVVNKYQNSDFLLRIAQGYQPDKAIDLFHGQLPSQQLGKKQRQLTIIRKIGANDYIAQVRKSKTTPNYMDVEAYENMPETMEIRLIRYTISQKGKRDSTIYLATSLMDADAYPAESIVTLYAKRWNIELEYRNLKSTMNLDVLKGESMDVIHKEIMMHIIAQSLIRLTA